MKKYRGALGFSLFGMGFTGIWVTVVIILFLTHKTQNNRSIIFGISFGAFLFFAFYS